MRMPGRLFYIIDALWLVLLGMYVVAGAALVPLHGDEPTQIYMARDYYTWFVEGNPAQLGYQPWEALDGDAATRQDLRLKDGIVARLVYGFAADQAGFGPEDLNDQWAWGSGWEYNHANGHVPADDLLQTARDASALILAGSVVLMFAIGWQLGGRATAYLGSVFYTLNPAILLNGRRAMMESTMLFFSLLVVLLAIYLLKGRRWWQFVLLGLASGVAVASKHTAAVTVAVVFLVCGLYWLWEARSRQLRDDSFRQITALFCSGIISLLVFVALNPAWWSDPLARATDVIATRADFIEAQQATFGSYADTEAQLRGFLRQTLRVPIMYAETELDGFVAKQLEQIEAYENSGLAGVSVGSTWLGALLLCAAVLVGFGSLILRSETDPSTRWLVGCWSVAMLSLTFLTPLEWQRYYLPAYPVVSLLAGLGIAALLPPFRSFLTARFR